MAEATARPTPSRVPAAPSLIQRCGDHPCSPGGCLGDKKEQESLVGRKKLGGSRGPSPLLRRKALGGSRGSSPLLRRKADFGAAARTEADPIVEPGEPERKLDEEEVVTLAGAARIQAKLRVSEPADSFEREADEAADRIMRAPEIAEPLRLLGSTDLRGRVARRQCAECEEDEKVHRMPSKGREEASDGLAPDALDAIRGRGQPLPEPTRTFFESRFGHDFGSVRVHADSNADRLASSVHARAFTHRNNIVFRAGEYSPNTFVGRHLLAHELTHTIQQGASRPMAQSEATISPSVASSSPPQLQRLGDLSKRDPALACPVPVTSPGSAGTSVMFAKNSFALSAADKTFLSSIAAAWHSGGGAGTLRVDGFASRSGPDTLNWPLSCKRAEAVAAELMAPSDGSPGVPGANVAVFASGETTEFDARLHAPNQRVVITTTGGAPAPGPPCPLAITGPATLDHYCAAYVPNDVASCGTFPAPNITLTATGAAPGETLTWGIVAGTARVGFVGASTGTSVTLQGLARSAARDDVTIQVTNGTCTVTRRLTVLEPSSLGIVQTPANAPPNRVQTTITYTVRDQFGNAMGAGICWDETVTVCSNNAGGTFRFGDAPTNASGQVTDILAHNNPGGIPAGLCIKLNQTILVGGCGPVQQNTIVYRASGVVLNPGASCAVGDPCP
jgi:outer membrane protein OmpA-like peptidoglycan-associated protein